MWASTVPTPGAFLICMAMYGNGYQQDAYGKLSATDPDGSGLSGHALRVVRGGSWYNRCSTHAFGPPVYNSPSYRTDHIGFRLGFQQVNQAPTDLNSTAALSISENQPVGTIVGEFNATDLDNNSSITYHFVSGENNNSLFTLESNGTLKTATTFDYETNRLDYTITVQAKDELNATTEGNFTVTCWMCTNHPARITP